MQSRGTIGKMAVIGAKDRATNHVTARVIARNWETGCASRIPNSLAESRIEAPLRGAWCLELLQRGTQPRVVEGPHAVDLRRRTHGGPCRAEQCPLALPLSWASCSTPCRRVSPARRAHRVRSTTAAAGRQRTPRRCAGAGGHRRAHHGIRLHAQPRGRARREPDPAGQPAWSARLYARFLRGRGGFAALKRWQAPVQHARGELLRRGLARGARCYGPPEIFNSDQESQFTSVDFTDVLKEAGVRISMDGKGRWMDNVFIERLWRSLKYECVYRSEFTTGSEARPGIGGWMDFYNRCRPHSSLNGRTPEEAYTSDEADRSLGLRPTSGQPNAA